MQIGDKMKLEEMSVVDKLNVLEACIAKADNSVEYSITCAWGQDKEASREKAKSFVEAGKALFNEGRIDKLDYDKRQEAIRDWNAVLDGQLGMFPEFFEKEKTK